MELWRVQSICMSRGQGIHLDYKHKCEGFLHIHRPEVRSQAGGWGNWLVYHPLWKWVPHLQKSKIASRCQKPKENHNPNSSPWLRDIRMSSQLTLDPLGAQEASRSIQLYQGLLESLTDGRSLLKRPRLPTTLQPGLRHCDIPDCCSLSLTRCL